MLKGKSQNDNTGKSKHANFSETTNISYPLICTCTNPTLLKRDPNTGVFLWILRNFLRTSFVTEHLWWLLLLVKSKSLGHQTFLTILFQWKQGTKKRENEGKRKKSTEKEIRIRTGLLFINVPILFNITYLRNRGDTLTRIRYLFWLHHEILYF